MSDYALGIDLGTTHGCVAVVKDGKAQILSVRENDYAIPSVVAISENGESLTGQMAKRQSITNVANTVSSVKRLIGRRMSDPEVQSSVVSVPYAIAEGAHGDIRIRLRGQTYALPEISAKTLGELRTMAQTCLDAPCQRAVITVPAYFNDAQRQATLDAGRIAGFEALHLLNSPTAAAIAYSRSPIQNKTIAIFDLGGGTFDLSIVNFSDGECHVLSTAGDTFLGGEDFDSRIVEHLILSFARERGIDLRDDDMAMQRLRIASEKAKCELSMQTSTQISLPFIRTTSDGTALHLNETLTRNVFEGLVIDLVKRTLKITQMALQNANLSQRDIDEVLLVGGMTRMPLVKAAVSEFFGGRSIIPVNTEESIAIGAAMYAESMIHPVNFSVMDVTPFDLGVEVQGGKFHVIIPKNAILPCTDTILFTTTRDEQTTLRIVVLQGESALGCENRELAEFLVCDIKPGRAGEMAIEVTLDVDADGIVKVTARDPETHVFYTLTVLHSPNLTPDEVEYLSRRHAQDWAGEKTRTVPQTEKDAVD